MERAFGERGCEIAPDRTRADIYFRCFLAFFSGGFLSVVFRVPQDVFFGFRVPLGVSRGVSRTSFSEEFPEFSHFGGGSKSMAGVLF